MITNYTTEPDDFLKIRYLNIVYVPSIKWDVSAIAVQKVFCLEVGHSLALQRSCVHLVEILDLSHHVIGVASVSLK